MKAVLIHGFDGLESIEIGEIPSRSPGANEVTIKISAAGVNPIDWKVAEGLKRDVMEYKLPITLGWECSGTIEAVGSNVSGFEIGERVCALHRTQLLHEGTFAEKITLPACEVAKVPNSITDIQAASFPLAATVAWQALNAFDAPIKDLLILGGSGGVGSFAIQLGSILSAKVTATGRSQNHCYLIKLGAQNCIDYRDKSKFESLEPFNAILDCTGEDALDQIYPYLKEGGKLVSITSVPNLAKLETVKGQGAFISVSPDQNFLIKCLKWFEEKRLQFPQIETFPFKEVVTALDKSRTKQVRGKLVLDMSPTKGNL